MIPKHNNMPDNIDENLNYIGFENDGHHHRHHHHKSKMTKAQKTMIIILFSIIGLIIAAISAFLIMSAIGKNQMVINENAQITAPETTEEITSINDGKTLIYKGENYTLNENMTSILCMGIDKNELQESQSYGGNGQADANFLMAVDTKSGKISVIGINRDTMVDVSVYSDGGSFSGKKKQQLCLAYANGDGAEVSCNNMLKSVSNIFYGIPINSYIAIDFNAVGLLNTAVGGVTVTPPDNFNYYGISFQKGVPMHLYDEKTALGFVRYRNIKVLDSNITRMQRQKQYLQAFAKAAVTKTKQDITFPISLYKLCNGYNFNNLNISKITFLTSVVMGNRSNVDIEFLNVDGTVTAGETNAEFTPDTDKLFELLLKVYYNKEHTTEK